MPTTTATDRVADQQFCAAMAGRILDRLETLWHRVPPAIAGDDPEAVHDLRVASRRLRAALDAAAFCHADDDWYPPLQALAKEITGALGTLRDREVLVAALRADRAQAPPEEWPGIDRLLERADAERQAAHAEMRAYLTGLDQRDLPATTRRYFSHTAGEGQDA